MTCEGCPPKACTTCKQHFMLQLAFAATQDPQSEAHCVAMHLFLPSAVYMEADHMCCLQLLGMMTLGCNL